MCNGDTSSNDCGCISDGSSVVQVSKGPEPQKCDAAGSEAKNE